MISHLGEFYQIFINTKQVLLYMHVINIQTELFLCYMHMSIHKTHTDIHTVILVLHAHAIDIHMVTPALHAHSSNTQAQTSMVPHILLQVNNAIVKQFYRNYPRRYVYCSKCVFHTLCLASESQTLFRQLQASQKTT